MKQVTALIIILSIAFSVKVNGQTKKYLFDFRKDEKADSLQMIRKENMQSFYFLKRNEWKLLFNIKVDSENEIYWVEPVNNKSRVKSFRVNREDEDFIPNIKFIEVTLVRNKCKVVAIGQVNTNEFSELRNCYTILSKRLFNLKKEFLSINQIVDLNINENENCFE